MSEDKKMTGGSRCCLGLLAFLAQILLHGILALTLFWVIQYRHGTEEGFPFSWRGDTEDALEKLWNLHPVLMVFGFIYCIGQGNLPH